MLFSSKLPGTRPLNSGVRPSYDCTSPKGVRDENLARPSQPSFAFHGQLANCFARSGSLADRLVNLASIPSRGLGVQFCIRIVAGNPVPAIKTARLSHLVGPGIVRRS